MRKIDISSSDCFQVIITQDESPTLQIKNPSTGEWGEPMHNLHGAFSETLYLYEPLLTEGFQWGLPEMNLISVGLGLGYIELIICGWLIKNSHRSYPWRLISYEKEPHLRQNFIGWLQSRPALLDSDFFYPVYQLILTQISNHFKIPEQKIKEYLNYQYEQNRWLLQSEFHPGQLSPFKGHLIFYDVFSSHSQPELWSTENLKLILTHHTDFPCAFATYAATGTLKRVLLESGFTVSLIPGFGFKRQSTRAIRTSI